MSEQQLPAPTLEPVAQVLTWILSGASQDEIMQAIAHQWPKAKAKPLIVEAMKVILSRADPDPAAVKGFVIEATRHVYQAALAAGDFGTALRALKQLHAIAGHE